MACRKCVYFFFFQTVLFFSMDRCCVRLQHLLWKLDVYQLYQACCHFSPFHAFSWPSSTFWVSPRVLAQTKVTQEGTQSTFRLLRLALLNAARATSRMNTEHPYYQVDVCFKISELRWVLANSSPIPSNKLHCTLAFFFSTHWTLQKVFLVWQER